MSLADAIGRIQEIQQTIIGLETGTAAAGSPTDAAGFDQAMVTAGTTATAAATGSSAVQPVAPSPTGVTGQDIVNDARKYIGVPYVFGGTTRAGMDCSGLVQTVLKDEGISAPRVVPDQAKIGTAVPSLADARPGDLIVLKGEDHIVIYAGDGKVIHAPHTGTNVKEVNNWLTDGDIATIRRVVPTAQPAATAPATAASASTQLAGDQVTQLLASLQGSMATAGTGAGTSPLSYASLLGGVA